MNRWHLILALVSLMSLGALSGCAKSASASDDKGAMAPTAVESKINVKVREVGLTSVTETIAVLGETQADSLVTYSAEVPGQVEYLGVKLGQKVRPGQVLARIDYTSLKAQADQARAQHTFAKKTYARLEALKKEDLVTQEQLDGAESNLLTTEAQLKIATANLKNSVVRARRGGVVTDKRVEQGEYVGPGAPMLQVTDYRTVVVEGQLPESQVAAVAKGMPVKVSLPALNTMVEGQVDTVLPVANPASRTFRVRIKVPNPELEILVGMSARVEIAARRHEDVVVATQDVVVEDGHEKSVFVAEGGVARKRVVQLGAVAGDQVILDRGVKAGERLVVLGHRSLKDGQPIRVIQ